MPRLEGRVAIITGAGNGIGHAVARLFADAGATLLVNDLGTDATGKGSDPAVIGGVAQELRAGGANVLEHSEDISTQQGVDSLISAAVNQHGRIDILVNCAGILRERALLSMRDRDLVAVLDVHVVGTFRLMQAAALVMREQGGGRIVNTTSNNALFGNTGQCANSAASAAIIGLTRSAAIELVRQRIYVNAVAPLAKTRQTEGLPLFQKSRGMTPEHVAPAYLFLASDLAGDMSGEVVTIAGDRISALRVAESEGVFSESETGLFDVDGLQAAWEKIPS